MFHSQKKILELKEELEKASLKIGSLEKQYNYLQAVLESMAEAVIVVSKDTNIISINPSGEKIFGVAKESAQGRFFLEVIPNNDIAEVIDKVFKSGKFISQEFNLVWPQEKVFQLNASPIFTEKQVSGCLLVIHDITEIRKLEAVRRDFVANVSHELKTPLTSIKGFVETLLEGALDDKANSRNFLKIIEEHTDRLNNLINDLLDLSYVESKAAELQLSDFNLRGLSESVILGFRSQLKKKCIEVTNNLPSDIFVKADRDKIEQVFVNLIDNAIKFNSDKGAINISSEDGLSKIKVVVEDKGVGIPGKDLPRIFERFYRVDKARSRELGGTGLGLSIVKHIVELHKGSVGVESVEAQGSKFWFIIPK